MTLDELEHHEQVALVALLGLMARLDLQTSPEEIELLEQVGEHMGAEAFLGVAREAAQLPDELAVFAAASDVQRPEAREVIYELLYDMAIHDTIVAEEAHMLDRLADMWGLPQRMGTGG
jgi:hypothetical protein